MITPPPPPPQGPLLTLAVLHRALSQQRLDAYRHTSDTDDADTLARSLTAGHAVCHRPLMQPLKQGRNA